MKKTAFTDDLKTAEKCLLDLLDCDPWRIDKEAGLKKVSHEVLEENIKRAFWSLQDAKLHLDPERFGKEEK